MSTFVEFLVVAFAIYVWESALWIPLRAVVLRRRRFGPGWNVLKPEQWLALKETGVVPLLPLLADGGLAPCQAPPLIRADGEWWLETGKGRFVSYRSLGWEDIGEADHHLTAKNAGTRLSSPRIVALLRKRRRRGETLEEAVEHLWKLAMSPRRAELEWRRWKMVSGVLHLYGTVLTLGFFVGLPAVYVFRGSFPALMFGLWLWLLMVLISARLWWLGKRVYPDARAALRMDSWLALLVPFHAMRAGEIASAHAMGTTHPVALMLAEGGLMNPWLAACVRRSLHPLPGVPGDAAFGGGTRFLLESALRSRGMSVSDFETQPDHRDDPEATRYCPRCHGLYQPTVDRCPDCHGLPLRNLV